MLIFNKYKNIFFYISFNFFIFSRFLNPVLFFINQEEKFNYYKFIFNSNYYIIYVNKINNLKNFNFVFI